jgi:hypothetical protein
MSKFSKWLRDLVGGFLALAGAGLVSWQAVLAYYLIIGRIQVGEEHPPFIVIAILFIIGIFLFSQGTRFQNLRCQNRKLIITTANLNHIIFDKKPIDIFTV